MAVMMPTGAAMSMAMAVTSSVPANSGTAPKAPDEPTWSARMAVCGLHSSPNRNSVTGTRPKKRSASNSTEATIPIVVSTATLEASHSNTRTNFSTRRRAANPGRIRLSANTVPASASPSEIQASVRRDCACSRW